MVATDNRIVTGDWYRQRSMHDSVVSLPDLSAHVQHFRSIEGVGCTFVLRGMLKDQPCIALWDSGAGPTFVSYDFVLQNDIAISTRCDNITLATGDVSRTKGTVMLNIRLLASGTKDYEEKLTFTVMDLPKGIDCILGDRWSRYQGVIADYGVATTTGTAYSPPNLWLRNCRVRILPEASLRTDPGLFFAQNELSAGEVADLAGISSEMEESSEDDTMAMQRPERLEILLKQFSEVFNDPTVAKFKENTPECVRLQPGSRPPNRPPFRLSLAERAETEKQVNDLLKSGRIVSSHSAYGAPVLFVAKRNTDALRMCIDYRALNQLTIRNKYPMPRIDDLLDNLSGACYFSSLDLTSGYWQIALNPKDWEKTAFNTHLGKFEWRVMPFGLTNAPAVFQAVMHQVFAQCLNKFVCIYLDDILVFSRSMDEHYQHITVVLQTLKDAGLKANMKKCEFFKPELIFLGHVVTEAGLKPDPSKVNTVVEWPHPKSVYEVRSFLGLANYFRRYIQGYAKVAAPLTDLLKGLTSADKKGKLLQRGKLSADKVASLEKDFTYRWTPECQKSFMDLKEALVSAPVLKLPDFDKPFVIECDASENAKAVGGILIQEGRPVAYMSKKLSGPELNYSVSDIEMMAVIYCLREWRCYLEGKPFIIVTDHQPNTYLDKASNPHTLKRRARWLYESAGYDYQWQYKPGKRNPADPLSRAPQHFACFCAVLPAGPYSTRLGHVATGGPRNLLASAVVTKRKRKRKTAQVAPEVSGDAMVGRFVVESFLARVKEGLKLVETLSTNELKKRGYRKDSDGLLWTTKEQLYIPKMADLREDCIAAVHSHPTGGHYGLKRTLEKVREVFFWEGQKSDVADFVRNCDSCQRTKALCMKPQGELHPLNIPFRRWESISMDLITDLPETKEGFTAIVVFVDRLSKMVHLAPCTKHVTAEQLGQLLEKHVFRLHGVPQDIVSDRDIRFETKFWQESCSNLKIKLNRSTAQHPQSDGQTERANGVLEDTLRHFVSPNQDDWDELLSVAEFAMNNAYNESIQTTPFMLNYGQTPDTPVIAALRGKNPHVNKFVGRWGEQLKTARDCLVAAQARQKKFADKHRRPAEQFQVGDQVLISMKHFALVPGLKLKLAPRFIGPFPITELIGPSNLSYRVELPPPLHRKHNVFHVSSLKRYHASNASKHLALPCVSEAEASWHVDCITDTKGSGMSRQYLVHWMGGGESWEFAYRLAHADKHIAGYWHTCGETPPPDAFVSLEELTKFLEGKQLSGGE